MGGRSDVEIQPLTADRLGDLADLFGSNGTTRGCWCMFFIAEWADFGLVRDGGNRRAFEALAERAGPPMGLLAAAVDLAERSGARAIEGFPRAAGERPTPDDYLGKEQVFAACGFDCIARPTPKRAVMRRDFPGAPQGAHGAGDPAR